MDDSAFHLQAVVRSKAAALGAEGEAWLIGLPALIAELEDRWSVTVLRSMPGGTEAYVGAARSRDGAPVVMKLGLPVAEFADEIDTLKRARGRGYVRLLESDHSRCAILMEALGSSMDRTDMPPEAQIATLCRLLAQAWEVPRAETGSTVAALDKATELSQSLGQMWQQLDGPCSAEVVDRALLYADRRARDFDPDRCVVVHGDASPSNALQVTVPRPGAETGFAFVDPDGFVGDPAYDLGVALRDWCSPLSLSDDPLSLARHYCRAFADGSGLDETAIWEWGFLERVSTALYLVSLGAFELGRPMLDTAAQLL
jgi:streptomycin 6-kinase